MRAVYLINCSTCIDTRGTSSVITRTTKFECVAENYGIRSVGASTTQVLIGTDVMTDGMLMDNVDTMQTISLTNDDPDIGIAAVNGVDTSGGSIVVLSTIKQEVQSSSGDNSPAGGMVPGGDQPTDNNNCVVNGGEGNCGMGVGNNGGNGTDNEGNGQGPNNRLFDANGEITLDGTDSGIIAVGNSRVEVEGESCSFSPPPATESKGNAEIVLDCNN